MAIYKLLDICTNHVTRAVREAIRRDEFPMPASMTSAYGWLFAVDARSEALQELEHWPGDASSFLAVVTYAQKNGCTFILFDRDAPQIDELTQFDW